VSHQRRGTGGGEGVPARSHALEEPLSCANHDRGDVGAQLVDRAGSQVLVHRGGAAGDGDLASVCCGTRLVEGRSRV
jgi:hypothetical protein